MRIAILNILLLLGILGRAQDRSLEIDAKELVKLTFNISDKVQNKFILLSSVPQEKREAFIQQYDLAVEAYIKRCANFYIETYTHTEIREMLKFYSTPVGLKIAADSRKLLDGNFPEDKEWDMQLYNLKETNK